MGFRLTAKLPLSVTKLNCRRSLSVSLTHYIQKGFEIKFSLGVSHISIFIHNDARVVGGVGGGEDYY